MDQRDIELLQLLDGLESPERMEHVRDECGPGELSGSAQYEHLTPLGEVYLAHRLTEVKAEHNGEVKAEA